MENITLKDMWKEYGGHIEESRVLNMQSWALNLQCLEMIQSQKVRSKLRWLTVSKFAGLFAGVLWIWFLGVLLYYHNFKNPFFWISVSAVLLFNLAAIINYIRHLVIIAQINYTDSITATQQKLASLQSSIVSNNRFLLLQFPFHTTWFYSWQWMSHDPLFWVISFPITILFTVLGIWLYKNYSLKNMHKPWVRKLMDGSGFSSVTKAMDFLDEIDDFKKDKLL